MGYTHYWRREKDITLSLMKLILDDFDKTLPELLKVVDLAGWDGTGESDITIALVSFNGKTNCGHPENNLGIPWPSDNASGIANPYDENPVAGDWFGGATLNKRACDGDCAHETFSFPRIMWIDKWQRPENGLYLEFCKTAFKPYDLAVITFLTIAKHHMKDRLIVGSDGNDSHWIDGKRLCQMVLGYGLDFRFIEGQLCRAI